MITKNTAYGICLCYDEIERATKLAAELDEKRKNYEPMNLRDVFGRPRGLQLGIPMSESGHQLYDVAPVLALAVIRAHIAEKQAELFIFN